MTHVSAVFVFLTLAFFAERITEYLYMPFAKTHTIPHWVKAYTALALAVVLAVLGHVDVLAEFGLHLPPTAAWVMTGLLSGGAAAPAHDVVEWLQAAQKTKKRDL